LDVSAIFVAMRPLSTRKTHTILGVDIGGSGVRTRTVTISPKRITLQGSVYRLRKPQDVSAVLDFIQNHCPDNNLAVVVAVAGEITADGMITQSSNARYLDGVPLQALLTERLSRPCIVDNDMEIGALGMHYLCGSPPGDSLAITWSSGIGGRYLHDGVPVLTGSELSHMIINPFDTAAVCPCGTKGCAEAYLGGSALSAMIRENPLVDWKAVEQPWESWSTCHSVDPELALAIIKERLLLMGIFVSNLLVAQPHCKKILWKGGVARKLLAIPEAVHIIRSTMVRPGWLHTLPTTPFTLCPGNPDDDTFLGCAIAYKQRVLVAH
jgi:predicted NBD/HSP70 family sugar kinase